MYLHPEGPSPGYENAKEIGEMGRNQQKRLRRNPATDKTKENDILEASWTCLREGIINCDAFLMELFGELEQLLGAIKVKVWLA